jgi:hypothetical protein
VHYRCLWLLMLGLVAGCTVGVDEQTRKQIGELEKESEQWRKESEQWRPLAEALNKSVDTTGKTLSASIVEASSKFGEGHDPLGNNQPRPKAVVLSFEVALFDPHPIRSLRGTPWDVTAGTAWQALFARWVSPSSPPVASVRAVRLPDARPRPIRRFAELATTPSLSSSAISVSICAL